MAPVFRPCASANPGHTKRIEQKTINRFRMCFLQSEGPIQSRNCAESAVTFSMAIARQKGRNHFLRGVDANLDRLVATRSNQQDYSMALCRPSSALIAKSTADALFSRKESRLHSGRCYFCTV